MSLSRANLYILNIKIIHKNLFMPGCNIKYKFVYNQKIFALLKIITNDNDTTQIF